MATTDPRSNDAADLARGDWKARLAYIDDMLREMSRETDPQAMVRAYGKKVRTLLDSDRFVSLSRRGVEAPKYRITRSSTWETEVNPWRDRDRLPLIEGGLLGQLLYDGVPRIIDDIRPLLRPDDPGLPYFEGMRSLITGPHYDGGECLNMVVQMKAEVAGFRPEEYPEWVWVSGLFGRATHNLVLSGQLKEAYAVVERELQVVADLQRSLLPKRLPEIPGLGLAAHYQTSTWAGGDYYDVFALPDDRWGLMIADVSGHGTPAAVMMAVTHSIAHTYPGPPADPAAMLSFINHHLSSRYTSEIEAFVTAFYGIYDPKTRTLQYASAGHNPPRLKRCEDGSILALDVVGNLPLGVDADVRYDQATLVLRPHDQIILYTDGITEATAPDGRTMFGVERLDEALENCHLDADGLIKAVLDDLAAFTEGAPASDDRTLLVAKVR